MRISCGFNSVSQGTVADTTLAVLLRPYNRFYLALNGRSEVDLVCCFIFMAKGFISDCEGGDAGERSIFTVGGVYPKLLHRSMLSETAAEDLEVLGLLFKRSGCAMDHQESTAFLQVSI
jgi:hypothetical protein